VPVRWRMGFDQFDAMAAGLGLTNLGLAWEGLSYDFSSGQWGSSIPSPIDLQVTGKLYGKSYDQTFSAWNTYADWRTGIAALPLNHTWDRGDFGPLCNPRVAPPPINRPRARVRVRL
jgi:hypothetical protein